MKKMLLLVAALLLSACTMNNYTVEKLSASCRAYFDNIDRNLAKSKISATKLTNIKQGFERSKVKLGSLPIQEQEQICKQRLAQLKEK